MTLNIYYSNSVDNCTQLMFSKINANSLTENYIIITPDRRTLLTEEELFKIVNKKSLVNVNVTTFTRFANDILTKTNNNNFKLLNKASAVALIKKIMLENVNDLKAFKKAVQFDGVASEIFETISMLKSCNVSVENLTAKTNSDALNNKLNDIKLIYEKYENYLQNNYTDSFNKLSLLSITLNNYDLKNTHIQLMGFDDFTPQMYDIISKLIKSAKSVSVSCAANFDVINNKNIYLNNIYLNLLDLSKIIGVKPTTFKCNSNYSESDVYLSENLFSYYADKFVNNEKNNKLKLLEFDSKENEIEFISKQILTEIKLNNKKYSDFIIITPSIKSYKTEIEKQFKLLNIPYFLDEGKLFTDNIIVRFYLNLFNSFNSNFAGENVFMLLKTLPVFKNESIFEYENLIEMCGLSGPDILKPLNKYSFKTSEKLNEIYEFLSYVKVLHKSVKGENNISLYIEELKKFSKNINLENVLFNVLTHLQENENVISLKETQMAAKKISEALNDIEVLMGEYVCSFNTFTSILTAYLNSVNLSLPPIEIDTVFVADSVASFINNADTVFVVGSNEGQLPVALDDIGIITDSEIGLLNAKHKLSPTVSYINKRNKFLLYEKLLKAKNNLVISYLTVNSKNEELTPASFVKNLSMNYFYKDHNLERSVLENGSLRLNFLGHYDELSKESMNSFIFNNIDVKMATENFINKIKHYYFYSDKEEGSHSYFEVLNNLNYLTNNENKNSINYSENLNYKNYYDNIENAKELFFPRSATSVSQLESFFKCPFEHFISYGLKLSEKDSFEIEPRDIGNIFHEYCSLIMPHIILLKKGEAIVNDSLRNLSNNIFEDILKNKKFEIFVNNPKNLNIILSLKNESERILEHLVYEYNYSLFNPIAFEERFGKGSDTTYTLQVNDDIVSVNGIIDRVDVYDNYFRVVDYKTGQSNLDFKEIVSGNKLQLFVYLKVYENKSKLKPAGAFYMPLKNQYIKGDKDDDSYKFKGIILNELNNVLAMDTELNNASYKSSIVNLKTNKQGEISKDKLLLEADDVNWISDYVVALIKQGYKEIISGNITPYPLKLDNNNDYRRKELIAINNFNTEYGNSFRRVLGHRNFNKEHFIVELNLISNNKVLYNTDFTFKKIEEENAE